MKKIWIGLLLIFVVLTAFTSQVREDITWINGAWKGLGYQPSLTLPWEIELDCNVTKKKFEIRYPSLNCQGQWNVVKADANRIIFREKIAKGEHTCVLSGKIIVTYIDKNHISYSYFDVINGKDVLNSFSTLIKQ